MTSEEIYEQLKKEKEELQFQLQDLEYLIQIKEEELAELKNKAQTVVALQSRFDERLYEIEQMQLLIGDFQQKAMGSANRESALEEELIQSIRIEKKFYSLQEQFNSTIIALDETNAQLNEAVALYKKVTDLKAKVTELESNLEIAQLDNHFLKEELEQFRSVEKNINSEN